MRFDMDVARQILLAIEATPANQYPDDVTLENVDEDTVLEHIALLIDKGLIDGKTIPGGMGDKRLYGVHIEGLTWNGHEFLANARNEQVWSKTKSFVKEKGGSISFEILKALLVKIAAQHVGLTV